MDSNATSVTALSQNCQLAGSVVKVHGSLRCTPAMEAGIEKSAWTVSDLVNAA
jgi:hypothetical protein